MKIYVPSNVMAKIREIKFVQLFRVRFRFRCRGVGYQEIKSTAELETGIRSALCQEGPVLVRVHIDYGKRPVRWIDATKKRYTAELTAEQKARFLARIGSRALQPHPWND